MGRLQGNIAREVVSKGVSMGIDIAGGDEDVHLEAVQGEQLGQLATPDRVGAGAAVPYPTHRSGIVDEETDDTPAKGGTR